MTKLCDLGPDDSVTSISWATSGKKTIPTSAIISLTDEELTENDLAGNFISVGANSGKIQIWDCTTCRVVRDLQGHESRVGTMAWSSTLLASGSRDRNIYLQDIRVRGSANNSNNNTSSNSGNSVYNMTMSRSRDSYIEEEYAHNMVSEIAFSRTQMDSAVPRISTQPSIDYTMSGQSLPVGPATAIGSPSSPAPASSSSSSTVRQLSGHKQEVCGLKWSFDEKMLASG